MPTRPKVLYVSNLAYPARGRRCCDEDIHLTAHLRKDFDLAICHPEDAASLMAAFDTVVVRNSGPVIPTIDDPKHLDRLPRTDEYVVKPKAGADSHGLKFVARDQIARDRIENDGNLIQPRIDFRYEVSFYFVDHDFQYALHAPDPAQRWELAEYTPAAADLEFARKFIDWNDLDHGVQRVDACRTREGDLLLVELEDLNPYL